MKLAVSIHGLHPLTTHARWRRGDQRGAATGLVAFECHRDTVDQHLGIAFGNHTDAMAGNWTCAAVSFSGDSDAVNL